jgi:hypothetical protein
MKKTYEAPKAVVLGSVTELTRVRTGSYSNGAPQLL